MKILFNILVVISLAAVSGCTTVSSARRDGDQKALRAEIYALKSRLEGIDEANQQMYQQFETIRAQGSESGRSQQEQIADLRRELDALRNSQEALKASIVAELSGKMAKVMSEQIKNVPSGEVGRYHTVAKGESLSAIASAYNSRVDLIVKANSLRNPNAIKVGQRLFIPE